MSTSLPSDPAVTAHLSAVRELFENAGAIEFLHEVVRVTWKLNRARWSPGRHFDDVNTLGHQTSRNVNNRIYRTIETSDVAQAVLAHTESGIVILTLGGNRLRVVKAPIESGLSPDLYSAFDWGTSSTRETAARRNSNAYYPLLADLWTLELEGDPRPEHRREVDRCKDFFLVWAAGLKSDRTAAWLGLPRLGDSPWMGVVDLWMDEATATEDSGDTASSDSSDPQDMVDEGEPSEYDEDFDEEEDPGS